MGRYIPLTGLDMERSRPLCVCRENWTGKFAFRAVDSSFLEPRTAAGPAPNQETWLIPQFISEMQGVLFTTHRLFGAE